MYMYY